MQETRPQSRIPWPDDLPPLVVVADNIRSMHNVGAIFRTADGAGFGGVVLCGITATPPRQEIRKAALGAEDVLPWTYFQSTLDALQWLRGQGYFLLALEKTASSQLIYRISVRTPLAVIVGHEFHGIREEVLQQADAVAHLPMRGHKISLNVSVAFGVAAYELSRRVLGEE